MQHPHGWCSVITFGYLWWISRTVSRWFKSGASKASGGEARSEQWRTRIFTPDRCVVMSHGHHGNHPAVPPVKHLLWKQTRTMAHLFIHSKKKKIVCASFLFVQPALACTCSKMTRGRKLAGIGQLLHSQFRSSFYIIVFHTRTHGSAVRKRVC